MDLNKCEDDSLFEFFTYRITVPIKYGEKQPKLNSFRLKWKLWYNLKPFDVLQIIHKNRLQSTFLWVHSYQRQGQDDFAIYLMDGIFFELTN